MLRPASSLPCLRVSRFGFVSQLGFSCKGVNQPSPQLKTLHSPRGFELRQRLRAAREEAGITQQDLAARLDKPQSFVSKYETGERRLDVIEFVDVCQALEVDAAGFLSGLSGLAEGGGRRSSSRKTY